MTLPQFLVLPLLIGALIATGCDADRSDNRAAPAGSTVKILATSPDLSRTLTVGDAVILEVEAEYRLNADSGTLSLVVQESDTSTIAVHTDVVTRGTGTVEFEAEFIVPETKAVLIFTPLTEQGQTSTTIVDTLAFEVQADKSDELNLEEAALIDAIYCAISGVTIGSTYQDVVSAFGQPVEESVFGGDSADSETTTRSLDYDGAFVGLKNGSAIIVSSDRAEYGVHGGLAPTSTRDELIQEFGETVGMSEEDREVLAYWCRDLVSQEGKIMVAVRVVGGIVESISIVADDED